MKQILRIGEGYGLSAIKRYIGYVLLIITGVAWLPNNKAQAQTQPRTISGTVISAADSQPLEGATIKLKSGGLGVMTDKDGRFRLPTPIINGTLVVTNIGYKSAEALFDIGSQTNLVIRLEPDDNSLDEVQVIGYGQVSKRFNTGSVVTVTAQEIERQPVSNPLAALAGRVPGMTVTQTSGNPGGKFEVQIRGQNSISQGSEPLFLIDGVPYPNDYVGAGFGTVMGNGGQNAFSNINPLDIASIDVLKDADATAIYGSRGANGVVLITTKKGKEGKTSVDASVYKGWGTVPKKLDMLNTQQYMVMRREALANDGLVPTVTNAPDLLLWDTTRYTNWQDYLIGGTARYTNANVALSGGNRFTQFIASANYNRQTTVNPGDFAESRAGMHLNLNHTSIDERFKANISVNYSVDNNSLPYNLSSYITMPPNTPSLLDGSGALVWSENGSTFFNPLNYVLKTHQTISDNLTGSFNLSYEILEGLIIKATGGYTFIQFNEKELNPVSSLDPNGSNHQSSSRFANSTSTSWILEPQVEYNKVMRKGSLNVLLGTSLQNDHKDRSIIKASDFPSDELLEATAFAKTVTSETSVIEYRYQALFGRINYNYQGKYLLNLTGRRDGSSRFGPNKRVANFGAIGGAWVFSEELKSMGNLKWLSFGKVRSSYGVTGNDQIGDYQYLDDYRAALTAYQGQKGYTPSRLFNADFSWERNKKLEVALDLGFLKNKLSFNASWFRNRSDNQLVNYKLPNQTGFNSILRNFGALVQNTGWEFLLSAAPINTPAFSWQISANATIERNKLLKFPGLEASSYANSYVIGKSLDILKLLHYTGVDSETGLYTFHGTAKPADQTVVVDLTPRYYGGFSNNVSYKNWELSLLVQFVKQERQSFGAGTPGSRNNQLADVLDRWTAATPFGESQRFTTTGAATTAYTNFVASDGAIVDGSYLRLKNGYLSYSLPNRISNVAALTHAKVYLEGQNLLTITNFNGPDPETGMPALRVLSIGIQLTL